MKNLELENQFLSILVDYPEEIESISTIIKPKHFSDNWNRKLFEVMLELHKSNDKIDIILLNDRIEDQARLFALEELIPNIAHLSDYACLLHEKWLRRQLLEVNQNIIKEIKNTDPIDLIDNQIEKLKKLSNDIPIDNTKHLFERGQDIIDSLIERRSSKEEVIKSNLFPSFNSFTGGLVFPTYMSIQGKDKSAKTTLALAFTLDVAQQNIPVGFFNLETTITQLDWKILSLWTGINYSKLRNPKGLNNKTGLSDDDVKFLRSALNDKFANSKIYTSDKIASEIQIGSTIKKWKRKFGCKFFVIDYIGLIPSSFKEVHREERINEMSRYFRQLSKDENIIIVVISQQNRNGEIAESKALERDPDFCWEVKSPFSENGEEKYLYKPWNFTFDKQHYAVKLKKSRHSQQGQKFVMEFSNNQIRESEFTRKMNSPGNGLIKIKKVKKRGSNASL